MIKNKSIWHTVIWALLAAMLVTLFGCAAPGRTASEVHRDHARKVITENKQLQDDWDDVLMLDRPSRLSDKYVR